MEAFAAALILLFVIVYLVVRIVAFVAAFRHGQRARKEGRVPPRKTVHTHRARKRLPRRKTRSRNHL